MCGPAAAARVCAGLGSRAGCAARYACARRAAIVPSRARRPRYIVVGEKSSGSGSGGEASATRERATVSRRTPGREQLSTSQRLNLGPALALCVCLSSQCACIENPRLGLLQCVESSAHLSTGRPVIPRTAGLEDHNAPACSGKPSFSVNFSRAPFFFVHLDPG